MQPHNPVPQCRLPTCLLRHIEFALFSWVKKNGTNEPSTVKMIICTVNFLLNKKALTGTLLENAGEGLMLFNKWVILSFRKKFVRLGTY